MEWNQEHLKERFLRYVAVDTQADSACTAYPSTAGQRVLGEQLVAELQKLGLTEILHDENGYVTATLPANGCEQAPVIGLIAHLDTSPDMAGSPAKPRTVASYPGGDIVLNADKQIVLSPREFPELEQYIGQDLLVTDGNTLLGADDKAGICSIISAVEYLLAHPEIPHGKVRIAFTPDEEIGRSALRFDVPAFGAEFAYTVDGGAVGSIEYENFNAANVKVTIHGRNVHPGASKGKMLNALTLAAEWQLMLPAGEKPEYTEGYEGFFHVNSIHGNVEEAQLSMLVRDHDGQRFAARKELLQSLAKALAAKYGQGVITLEVKDLYYNMREKIEPVHHIIDMACQAMETVGVTPRIEPIRGGTDGARLSFCGLPCPNLFTGGHNFHGKFEFLPLPSLMKSAQTVVEIVRRAGQLQASK